MKLNNDVIWVDFFLLYLSSMLRVNDEVADLSGEKFTKRNENKSLHFALSKQKNI